MKTFGKIQVGCRGGGGGILIIFGLLAITSVYGGRSPPTVRLFEIGEDRRIVKLLTGEPDSEFVLENVKAVRLDCSADYPVQWIYSGNGVPLMETRIASSAQGQYMATAYMAKVTEMHTGKYKCASTEESSVLSYIYLYAPGQLLFNVEKGKTVEIDSTAVQIPCTASSPRVSVYLIKAAGPRMANPAEYDPRRGFLFQVQEIRQAEGAYLCKAAYHGATNVLEYQVKVLYGAEPIQKNPAADEGFFNSTEPPCNPPCAPNAKCVFTSGDSVCQCLAPFEGDGLTRCERPSYGAGECRAHSDCPDYYSCFADFVCRDPCTNTVHNLQCGANAVCKTVNHEPTCACPGGTYGNPLQGCAPVAPARLRRQASGCTTHTDCPENQSCFADHICRDPCTNTLHGLECGTNAVCQTVKHEPTCACPEDYFGDPLKGCHGEPPQQADEEYPEPISSTKAPPVDGQPSGKCKTHGECDEALSCFADGVCRDPCVSTNHGLKCGLDAICKTINHRPACACPGGYLGDPLQRCIPRIQGDAPVTTPSSPPAKAPPRPPPESEPKSKCDCGPDCECICRADGDCPSGQVCKGASCVDPCDNTCGPKALCTAVNGVGLCSCPEGYRGDPKKGCSPSRTTPRAKTAPGTLINCTANSDCPSKYTCEDSVCRDPCRKCTRYAVCDFFEGDRPTCMCPEGYTGDGTISCTPDLNFELPAAHPTEKRTTACSTMSCGPHSECRIVDGLPKCNCISGYVGSPPNCKAECRGNEDCKETQICVQRRCRTACLGRCAKGARCVVEPDTRTATCKCRKGLTGDPEKECIPMEVNKQQEPRDIIIDS